jgi:2-C-methyl-D-erythritol 2,4-cyclodiphosphate synthase
MRIGQGFDVHRLIDNDPVLKRPLMLGGVEIPFDKCLKGHSDADVLLHAICDAMLGAVALGDIGLHFPDNESRWKDADSWKLLQHVSQIVIAEGYVIANLDATVICELPKIRPYVDSMRNRIADALDSEIDIISIKGTTTEKLGYTGRGEGIAANAIVLLKKV